jgi:lysophospholipase L1-like esterase
MKNLFLYFIILIIPFPGISQIKVACVGNSITYGAYIENREENAYPQQLNKILGPEWEVANFGRNAATLLKKGDLPYWEVKEFEQAKAYQPDVVIIKLGTNDSKSHNWENFKNDFKSDYKAMIRSFQDLESKPIVMLGIPAPVVKDEFTISKVTVEQTITTIIKQIANEENLILVDFYNILKDKEELLPDSIHPNAAGAQLMAAEAARVLSIFKEQIMSR